MTDTLKKELKKIKINKEVFKLYRKESKFKKSITKMIKYTCGCTIVRCATELKAKCELCGKEFEES